VHRVFLNPKYVLGRGAFFLFLTTFYNPPIERHFRQFLARLRPDLIHVHHLLYLSAGLVQIARQAHIPIVATLHDFWYFCPNAQLLRHDGRLCVENLGRIHCGACLKGPYGGHIPNPMLPLAGPFFLWRERMLRRAVSQAEVLIAPSQFLLERHVQAGFPREKLIALEHGIEPAPGMGPVPPREPHQPLRIGYIGSLTRHKGVHVLIDACRRLVTGQATLDVYGSPTTFPKYSAELVALAAGHPDIHFQGAFDHARLAEVLQGLDLLVVPSLWYENSPVVIQEALSMQVPVIASRIGSLPEKVREGVHGLLFEPGDADDLARVLGELAARPGQVSALMANLHGFRNDMEAHLERIEAIYDQVRVRT